jgi:hypothetical protein
MLAPFLNLVAAALSAGSRRVARRSCVEARQRPPAPDVDSLAAGRFFGRSGSGLGKPRSVGVNGSILVRPFAPAAGTEVTTSGS